MLKKRRTLRALNAKKTSTNYPGLGRTERLSVTDRGTAGRTEGGELIILNLFHSLTGLTQAKNPSPWLITTNVATKTGSHDQCSR